MFGRILKIVRAKIRVSQYIMSGHADGRMDDEDLTIHDVECAVLSGAVLERQRDHQTGEWKYRVRGESANGAPVEVVAKISPTGKLVIVTVYRV